MNVYSYPDLFGPLSDSEYLRHAAVECRKRCVWGSDRSLGARKDAENYVSNIVATSARFVDPGGGKIAV